MLNKQQFDTAASGMGGIEVAMNKLSGEEGARRGQGYLLQGYFQMEDAMMSEARVVIIGIT